LGADRAPQPSKAAAAPSSSHRKRRAAVGRDAVKPVDRTPFSFVSEEAQRYLDECSGVYHRNELLQVRLVRQVLARERMKHLLAQGALRRLANDGEKLQQARFDYNIEGPWVRRFLTSSMMFEVIKAIDGSTTTSESRCAVNRPRSEIEIFGMMAAGFHPDRIKAVDLFSVLAVCRTRDMHRLPYPDNSFDVVFPWLGIIL